MKKIGIVLAIGIALTLVVGCASSGGGGSGSKPAGGGAALKPYTVDLSTLGGKLDVSKLSAGERSSNTWTDSKQVIVDGKVVGIINVSPLTRNWDNFIIPLSLPIDVTQYQRVTINCKYYNAASEEIAQGDSRVMACLVYDIGGDLRGPAMGPGPNTPLKEMNVGGYSGLVSTDKGVRVRLTQPVGAILLQNNNTSVSFIELTQLTFHNGTASGQ